MARVDSQGHFRGALDHLTHVWLMVNTSYRLRARNLNKQKKLRKRLQILVMLLKTVRLFD